MLWYASFQSSPGGILPTGLQYTFRFSIEGGAEIPQFCLNLKHPNDDVMSLSFRVIWTAWGERGFYSERAQNYPDTDPDETHVYSFSMMYDFSDAFLTGASVM